MYFFFNESNQAESRKATIAGRGKAQAWDLATGEIHPLDGATAEIHDGIRGRVGSWQRALRALDVVASLPGLDGNRAALTSANRRNLDELDALSDLL